MTLPRFNLVLGENGRVAKVKMDGKPVPGVTRVRVDAQVGEPTRITLWQLGSVYWEGDSNLAFVRHDCSHCRGHLVAGGVE